MICNKCKEDKPEDKIRNVDGKNICIECYMNKKDNFKTKVIKK